MTVLLEDYRELEGRYDKLVSIEMIEAVGWQYFPTFFRRCAALLGDDGAMLLQAITIDERAYEVEKAERSFINTYIFPGGCLPSLEVISRSARARRPTCARCTSRTSPPTTPTTLAALARALPRTPPSALAELGYDERFRRLWELYLSYCEGGFRERRIQRRAAAARQARHHRLMPSAALGASTPRPPARLQSRRSIVRVGSCGDATHPVRGRARRLPRELSHVPRARGARRGGPLRRVGARRDRPARGVRAAPAAAASSAWPCPSATAARAPRTSASTS